MATTCPFCAIVAKQDTAYVVWEDNRYMAFLDIRPIEHGHTLLLPKQHAEDLIDLPPDHFGDFFETARRLAHSLRDRLQAPRVGFAVEGFEVPHAHLHLVPLYAGNGLDPNRAQRATREELEATFELLTPLL